MYAYAFIKHDGVVERIHAFDNGVAGAATPNTNVSSLEALLGAGYIAQREVVIPGGADANGVQLGSKLLLVLKQA